VARYLGPYLPDISGALVCFWILFLFVKKWRPKTMRGFGGQPLDESASSSDYQDEQPLTKRQAFMSWLPYLVLVGLL
jgi:lactate permease